MCAAHAHAVRLGVIVLSVPPAFSSASQPGV